MKKPTLLYIPLLLLAAFAFSALAVHFGSINTTFRQRLISAELPVSYMNGVIGVKPEAESAGIKIDDRIVEINGVNVESDDSFREAVLALQPDQAVTLKLQRKASDGKEEVFETQIKALKVEKNLT